MSEIIGRRLTPQLQRDTIGGTFEHTLRICLTHAGVEWSPELQDRYSAWMLHRMGQLIEHAEITRGVPELLHSLTEAGIPCTVVTNTVGALAHSAIERVGAHFFAGAITGDQVRRGKPDPEGYLTAAMRLGVLPDECLVFEDSAAGLAAARAAGCRAIDVTTLPTFEGVGVSDLHQWYETMCTVKNFDSLYSELADRAATRPAGSGTVAALDKGVHTLGKKVIEEAGEVWLAAEYQSNEELAEEISQLLYWTQVIMVARGVTPADVYKFL